MSKKASNPPPPKKQEYYIKITHVELTSVFNEWLRSFEENPDDYMNASGDDYGESCADYFIELHGKLK